MSIVSEFKAFVAKGNVAELALAVVVGGAFSDIVKTTVNAVVMPLISYVLPARMTWEEWTLGKVRIGLVLGAGLHFFIVAVVVFLLVGKLLAFLMKTKATETRVCPACLETVPKAARRCKFCTSSLVEDEAASAPFQGLGQG